MKHRAALSLKGRMLTVSLAAFIVMFSTLSVVFLQTSRSMEKNAFESLAYTCQTIARELDTVVREQQRVSELLAEDPRLLEHLEYVYDPQVGQHAKVQKQEVLNRIARSVFASYNRNDAEITAIYNNRTGVLFNFHPNPDSDAWVRYELRQLNFNDPSLLSIYQWYPLGPDFFAAPHKEAEPDPREDNVVFGFRRIWSAERRRYSYVHFLTITEQQLYDAYASLADPTGGQVYVVDHTGALISSSVEEVVAGGAAPEQVVAAALATGSGTFTLEMDGTTWLGCVAQTELPTKPRETANWLAVLLVPKNTATADARQMYNTFIVVLLLCIALSAGMLIYLYKQFMAPISKLQSSMQRVDEGDLEAYIAHEDENSETGRMIHHYNDMLRSVNRNIEDRVAFEKTRKKLDMQVLTTQINPHFLYNTLETIVWKASAAGHPDIGKIAASLGRMYRLSISGDATRVPLSQELEHLGCYVEILRARYTGQFTFELCPMPESLRSLEVPKIILQPIVENIFHYAVPEAERPVNIRVSIREKNGEVRIRILDNGPGMGRDRLEAVRRQILTGEQAQSPPGKRRGTGIGLHNISARLALYMGAEGALTISSKAGLGTRVELRFPAAPPGNEKPL